MNHTLVKLLGWKGAVLNGDPSVYDRWKWLSQKIQPGPVRTLDAGCGSGCFSFFAASQGNHVVGVDFAGAKLETAKQRAGFMESRHLTFQALDVRELDRYRESLGQFDQVLSFEVIEHVQNDRKLIADMAALLKPGGRLILATPYLHYKPLLGDKLSETEDGGHVRWGYTHEQLRALLEPCGLEILEEEFISGVVSQKLINVMRRGDRLFRYVGWGIVFPLRPLQKLDRPLTKLTGYPNLSIGVVARKVR